MFRALRTALQGHKIAEGMVAFAALVVGICAVYVAVQANEIASRQAEVAEHEVAPLITANLDYVFSEGRAQGQTLTVTNDGGPARAVNIDSTTTLRLRWHPPRLGDPDEATVVLRQYFVGHALSGAPTGVLAVLSGGDNHARMIRLERASSRFGKRRGAIFLVDAAHYLRVSYLDRLDRQHTEFLLVDPVQGSQPLSKRDGEAIFDRADDPLRGPQPPLTVSDATPRRLHAIVTK